MVRGGGEGWEGDEEDERKRFRRVGGEGRCEGGQRG